MYNKYRTNMDNWQEYSPTEMLQILGVRFREYRLRCNLTQAEVAQKASISQQTISHFESGLLTNMSLATLIALLDVVGRRAAFGELLPELPPSPYNLREKKPVQRIKHKQHE